ncbi:hypothetical protein [Brucella oryzae]|nr:hypothetical protein [Brucella oryzae]
MAELRRKVHSGKSDMRMIEMTSWLIEKTHGTPMPVGERPRNMEGQQA